MDICIRSALHHAVMADSQLENAQHVAKAEKQQQPNEQRTDVPFIAATETELEVLQAQRKSVDADHGQQGDDHCADQPTLQRAQCGQREHVEANVVIERRIVHAEVDAIDETQHRVPLSRRYRAKDHREKQ